MRSTYLLPALAGLAAAVVPTTCPAKDGTTVTSNNRPFHIQCGQDRPGGDLPGNPIYVSSLDQCISKCSHNDACLAAIWSQGAPGPCYLKSKLTTPSYNPNIQAAISPRYECPRDNGEHESITADSSYKIECYQDRIGGDLPISPVYTPDLETCLDTCESTQGCLAVSWNPSGAANGPCYLKSSLKTPFRDTKVWAAVRHSTCPDLNGTTIAAPHGQKYEVDCYADFFGGVIAPSPVSTDSFKSCVELCGLTEGCVAASWRQGFPAGTCYVKGSVGAASVDEGVWSARLVRQHGRGRHGGKHGGRKHGDDRDDHDDHDGHDGHDDGHGENHGSWDRV